MIYRSYLFVLCSFLQHPEHVQRLVLVGPGGFSIESDEKSEQLLRFKSTWMGAIISHLWESNITPQKVIRYEIMNNNLRFRITL